MLLYKQNSYKIQADAASNLLEIYMNISSYPGGGKWSGSGLKHNKTTYIMMTIRVVRSRWLPPKTATYLVSFSQLLCLAFLYGWRFLNEISPFTDKIGK